MSASEFRHGPAETVAGFLASASMAVSVMGVVYRPVRTIPIAVLVALVAVALGGPQQRLAQLAIAVGAIAFVVGMTVAVATESALW